MIPPRTGHSTFPLTLFLLAALLAGCAGYYASDPGWGAGYYEPGVVGYGGFGDWGGGYRVGPHRDGGGRFGRGGFERGGGGRSIPGIPTGERGGRGGGGGHGGGGHGGR